MASKHDNRDAAALSLLNTSNHEAFMSATAIKNVVVIGAGQAGLQVAQSLRKRGFDGAITLLGNEGYPAYQRPPLSKAFLKGQIDEARLFFKPDSFYSDKSICLKTSSGAVSIALNTQTVRCEAGECYDFDRLVISTGAEPVGLSVPGAKLDGVFTLRGISDSRALRQKLGDGARLVIIGGGYVGLEVASAARQLGRDVVLIERMPRLLSRVTSPQVSEFYLGLHQDHGVDMRLNESVIEILGDKHVTGVRLASGDILASTAVLVGIGVRPNQAIAESCGIACKDGILVDDRCRTSDPRVYAAGDCARRVTASGDSSRLESVHNALNQAERIAAHIVGDSQPQHDPPWFWSDQYDVKLQTAGVFNGYDELAIIGDPDISKFSAMYFRDNVFIAIDSINDPVSFMAGKQILKRGLEVSKSDAVSTPSLKALLAGATPNDAAP